MSSVLALHSEPQVVGRIAYLPLLRAEAEKAGLPWDVADAVAAIESSYDPKRIGGVGEIGLMQVRPGTAAMLGFVGSAADLMKPEVNIHYGVTYLAGAWRLAGGNLCQALMKYRAGHGETDMSSRSVDYCLRARAHLAAVHSNIAQGENFPVPAVVADGKPSATRKRRFASLNGTKLRGDAFWAAHDARIKALTQKILRRWKVIASR